MTALAASMVRAVASATAEDAELVVRELALLPEGFLQDLKARKVRLAVCREAVTDYRRDLARPPPPRGWPEGVDWTSVPGCYCPDTKEVVIATVAADGGGRRVPPKGVKHGAFSLVVHETMHADDYTGGRLRCRNAAFLAARALDRAALTDYERQEGQAGYEESYAESASRFFGGDGGLEQDCPRLALFWSEAKLPIKPGPKPRGGLRARAPKRAIGSAERTADGRILMDLVAESDETGVVGHALVELSHGQPAYGQVMERMKRRRGRSATRPLVLDPF